MAQYIDVTVPQPRPRLNTNKNVQALIDHYKRYGEFLCREYPHYADGYHELNLAELLEELLGYRESGLSVERAKELGKADKQQVLYIRLDRSEGDL